MHDLLQVILLAVIEGITEFLPISSTGHLLIAEHWLGKQTDAFNIFIQAGAVLSVVFIYRNHVLDLLRNGNEPKQRDYLLKLATAFGVTAVLGLACHKAGFMLPDELPPVIWALLIGGLMIFGAEAFLKGKTGAVEITWTIAVLVGLSQVAAGVFPGLSRSAATILVAMFLGLGRGAATEFSFLVGIPTMFAASAFAILKQRHEISALGRDEWGRMLVGFMVSMIVAFFAVKWLLRFVQTHTFNAFAWYRIALGLILLVWVYA